jgi:hypothetical protein
LRDRDRRTKREDDARAQDSAARQDPRRPDFIDVAGGLSARTTGGFGTCCGSLVASGTPWGCSFFFFFEKSGISFFLFM